MRPETIDVKFSTGRVLSSTIFRTGGRKLLAKGHILREEDIRILSSEGLEQVWVARIEEDEVPEDHAVCAIAGELACGSYQIQLASDGRANVVVTEDCCILVDDELLTEINCTTGLVIATTLNFSFAGAKQRVATVKSAPFAVSRGDLDASLGMLRDRGPVLQARPTRGCAVAVLYCDLLNGDKARSLYEPIVRQKLDRFALKSHTVLSVIEREDQVARGLQYLLSTNPCAILVASTTAPAGPDDCVGRGMERIGCQIERFLAPVEPGNLLLMGYAGSVPVVSAPGCFRSPKPNVVDLLLPPMLSRYRVSTREVANLGHGGLLS